MLSSASYLSAEPSDVTEELCLTFSLSMVAGMKSLQRTNVWPYIHRQKNTLSINNLHPVGLEKRDRKLLLQLSKSRTTCWTSTTSFRSHASWVKAPHSATDALDPEHTDGRNSADGREVNSYPLRLCGFAAQNTTTWKSWIAKKNKFG